MQTLTLAVALAALLGADAFSTRAAFPRTVAPIRRASGVQMMPRMSLATTLEKESVDKATLHWCNTVTSGSDNNWERVKNLYADDAILWGTVSEDMRSGQDLTDYFKYFAMIPGLSLKEGSYKSSVQVMGDSAINSGYYTFQIPQADGNVKAVPARFTFVYRRRSEPTTDGIEWDIVNHHSSAVPEQPAALSPVLASAAEISVEKATQFWCKTVTSGAADNWQRVWNLYAKDAILWATVSEDIRMGEDIANYFKWFAMIPGLTLKEGTYRSQVQMLSETEAINSGYFTFLIPQEGAETKVVPARFTFVYRKRAEPTADGIEWDVVNHHNSVIPAQPEALTPIMAKK